MVVTGNTSTVANFKLSSILPPAHELMAYYRYDGSMTTPKCDEAVIWTIFHRTLPASHRQVRHHDPFTAYHSTCQ